MTYAGYNTGYDDGYKQALRDMTREIKTTFGLRHKKESELRGFSILGWDIARLLNKLADQRTKTKLTARSKSTTT